MDSIKIAQTSSVSKLSSEVSEFIADYHNFTNKYPSSKIAQLLGVTRQNVYYHAKKQRMRGGESNHANKK